MIGYAPAHVRQLDGSPFADRNCAAAAGAIALDDFTGGRIRTTGAKIRELSGDRSGGLNMRNIDDAWRKGWGARLSSGIRRWPDLLARLRAGEGALIFGDYDQVPRSYSAQRGFRDDHAMYAKGPLRRSAMGGQELVTVYDPLASGPRLWPLTILRAFGGKLTKVGYIWTGWGAGPIKGGTEGKVEPLAPLSIPPGTDVYPIPRARVADPGACPAGYNRGIVEPQLRNILGLGGWVEPHELRPGEANACVRADLAAGSIAGQQIGAGLSQVGAAIGEAIGGAAFTFAVLLIIGLIALLGAWLMFREG